MDEANENYRKGGKAPTHKDPDKLTLEIHYGGTLMQVAVGKGDEYCGGEHEDLLSETASGTYKEAEGQKGEYEGQNEGQDGNGTKNGEVNMQEEREKAGNASENEESDEEDDTEFIDSDYEQDTDAEEVEVDDTMFEECIDNPIEEEPEEMGYAGEISDDVQNSKDIHSKQDNDDECDENGMQMS
ncbi:hypothetical protein Pyn_21152 [Prunus yedoensis var. nudiflora]|uniref:Uncharacterized protein n=1 Tax=Prunus yedoensis var. nudiflora TaxID=2094558 RepID=A0A314UYD3_PRUYE|nr:hypothetical protein Pyn_21152 [Prunus yedoensis var. nudiflora]